MTGYFAVILKSVTPDGWVVIGVLMVMAVVSWAVMVNRLGYLNRVGKGNARFLQEWNHLARDLTALDHGDAENLRTLGGRIDPARQRTMRGAPLYRIYHIGIEEIRRRFASSPDVESRVLSPQSLQAIRASLDGALVRETQKLTRLMVLLTIAIAGGPFLGLLGTVVGVMITFAAIAAAGDVNVNAIAPGIAAALVATVAGLARRDPGAVRLQLPAHPHQGRSTREHAGVRRRVRHAHGRDLSRPCGNATGGNRSGAMKAQDEDKAYDDINITPMLDLAYVLLVIFIIMTTASVQGIKVNLPKASAAPSLAKPRPRRSRSPKTARSSSTPPGDDGRSSSSACAAEGGDAGVAGDREGRLGPVPERDRRARPARAAGHHPARAGDAAAREVTVGAMELRDDDDEPTFLQRHRFAVGFVACIAVLGAIVAIGTQILGNHGTPAKVSQVTMIKLLPPPPTPPPTPPPQVQPQPTVQQMIDQKQMMEPETKPEKPDQKRDEPPKAHDKAPGPLGLNAKGEGAGDAFGLVGKPAAMAYLETVAEVVVAGGVGMPGRCSPGSRTRSRRTPERAAQRCDSKSGSGLIRPAGSRVQSW